MSNPGIGSKGNQDRTSVTNGTKKHWGQLTGSHVYNNTEEGRLSYLLHGILLIVLIIGIVAILEYSVRAGFQLPADLVPIVAVVFLLLAFFLNIKKYFKPAVILSIVTIVLAIFITLWFQREQTNISSILFYLLVPILLGEFFLSLAAYAIVSALIIIGIALSIPIDKSIVDILVFMIVFCSLVGLAGYFRHKLEFVRQENVLSIERRHARQMELLNSITHTTLQMPDTKQALQIIADQLSQLLDADGVFITLWDAEQQRVIPSTAYGDFRETYHNTIIGAEEKTLTASVLKAGHPLAIEDVRNTPYMSPRLATDVPTCSALALPLIAHNQKLGAAIISYNNPHPFTEAEIALGEQAAGQIALALSKIQSFDNERRNARQMELLNSITHASLNATGLQAMTQILADQIGELLGADGAFITLWDEDQKKAIPAAASGRYRDTYTSLSVAPHEKTLTQSVLDAGHPLIIEDVMDTPYLSRSIAEQFTTRSLLALPLIVNGIRFGAALIAFNQTHRFTPREVEISERAAAQIALAIYKSHLMDVSLRQVSQLELLSLVGREIARSLDEKEILERTLEAVVKKFGYAEAAISMLVNDDTLEIAAIDGTQDFGYRAGYRQKLGTGIIGHVAETRKPHVTGNVSQDPYYYSTAERHGSALGVPMLDKDELLGVIYVEAIRQNDFKPNDVQTLQTLANQVANSIQKARLYTRLQEHLNIMTTLQSVSQVMVSSLELTEILHTVIELLKTTFGYTYISIYLLDGDLLQLGAELGYPPDMIMHQVPVHSGIIGRAVRTKTTQVIRDVNQDAAFLRASHDVKSEICVPLLKKEDVLGVLNVESKEESPLDERDMNLLTALAGPLAIAIDNARLHGEVKTMALTDTLSGLANRRAFDDALHTELMRANRYQDPLSLIILDLDSFKQFNDIYGHMAGDRRLKEIGQLLRENVREPDLAARYGGEEFAIILPKTSKAGAVKLAERLRRSAEAKAPSQNHFDSQEIPGYTMSFGVACFPDDAMTLHDLLLAADNAELEAKRLGKNRVCTANMTDKFHT